MRRAACALFLLAAAFPARAVPVFAPEFAAYGPFASSAAVQSFAPQTPGVVCYPAQSSCYPLRAYFAANGNTRVATAVTPDGVTWTPESYAGALSTMTRPSISASSITAATVLPLSAGGYGMFYSAVSTSPGGDRYGIYSATSADGVAWANAVVNSPVATSTNAPCLQLSAGQAFVGSPRVLVLSNGNWRMYFTGSTDGTAGLGSRRVYTSVSTNSGQSWSAPSVLPSTVAYEVGASQLTDGRVRLYYSSPLAGQSSATVVATMLSSDQTGSFFASESAAIVSTAAASGSLAFPVPVRSTDSYRWRLYYDFLTAGLSTGAVFSALTGVPAPTSISPAQAYNTSSSGSVTVNGEIFSGPPVSFTLSMAGQADIVPFGVARSDDQTITGQINTLGAATGYWSLKVINADGSATTLPNALLVTYPPGTVTLTDNLISPRSGTTATKISINFYGGGSAKAGLYTIDGRRVATLLDGDVPAGVVNLTWNGVNAAGAAVPSGVYILRVTGPKLDAKEKIVVIR